MKIRVGLLLLLILVSLEAPTASAAPADDCGFFDCKVEPFPYPELSTFAEHVQAISANVFVASKNPPSPQFYT